MLDHEKRTARSGPSLCKYSEGSITELSCAASNPRTYAPTLAFIGLEQLHSPSTNGRWRYVIFFTESKIQHGHLGINWTDAQKSGSFRLILILPNIIHLHRYRSITRGDLHLSPCCRGLRVDQRDGL